MTRKEEREKAAKIRADQYSHPVEWNDCYHHWIEGAEWADKTMLDKVCEWLEDNIYDYLYINRDFNEADYKYGFIEDLRKTMEE